MKCPQSQKNWQVLLNQERLIAMRDNRPIISVIIPVYNTEKYLQQSLDSIFAQTMENFEIICVNDGSTDNSLEILKKNQNKISKIINKKNGGLSSARNEGLTQASGKYIYFFDSDDLLEPNTLNELYKTAKEDDLDLVQFEMRVFCDPGTETTKLYKDFTVKGIYNEILCDGKIFARKLQNDDFQSSVCLRLIRRTLLDRIHLSFYDGILHEDELFSVICDVESKRARHIPHKYFRRRIRSNSIMTASGLEINHVFSRTIVCLELSKYLEKKRSLLSTDVVEAVQKRISAISDAASWDFEHFTSTEKNKLISMFQAKGSELCILYTHIHDYAYANAGIEKAKIDNKFKEYQNKISMLEKELQLVSYSGSFATYPPENVSDSIMFFPEKRGSITVSVIVPIFNMERFLPESLESLISQTLKDIEIICIDDGSTDASSKILKEFQGKDPRIKIIQQTNQGVAAARNRGLLEASGDFVAFMDPDDFYPDCNVLEKLYEAARKYHVLISGGSTIFLENGVKKSASEAGFPYMSFPKSGVMEYTDYQGDYGFWRFLYCRIFLKKNNLVFPPYRRFQDPPFMVEAFARAGHFYASSEPVYVYRANYKTVPTSFTPQEKILDIYSGLRDLLNISGKYKLSRLHQTVVNRINTELIDLSDCAVYNGNKKVFLKLLELQKSVIPDLLGSLNPLLLPLQRIQQFSEDYNRILFSVIVPVYGTEQYLSRCIESIRNQTWKRFEVIFVDDASPGNCKEIIEGYHDSRFHYVRHDENRGLLAARLTGATKAKGEYILALDSDDTLDPWLLASIHDTILNNSLVDIIMYKTHIIQNGVVSDYWANIPPCEINGDQIFQAFLDKKIYWSTCGKCYHRELYMKGCTAASSISDLKVNSAEDLVLFLPIAYYAKKLIALDCFGYNYFKHDASVSGNVYIWDRWVRTFSNLGLVWKTIIDFAKRQGCSEQIIFKIRNMQWSSIVWGLREIHSLPKEEWNSRVAFLLNNCFPELVYARIFEEYRTRMAEMDFKDVFFPHKKLSKIHTIALVCSVMNNGGAERATAILIYKFLSLGYRVILFTNQEPQSYDYDYPSIPRFILPEKNIVIRWDIITRRCAEFEVDIAILENHTECLTLIDLACFKHYGAKVIMQEHSCYFFPLINTVFMHQFLFRKPFYKLADAITCLSDLNEKWWHADGYPQTVYIPNFLTFTPANAQRSSCESNDLLFIGRMTEKKGIFDALRIMEKLREKRPNVKLHFLGRFVSQEEEKRFMDQIESAHLADNVCYEGHVANVGVFLKNAAALIMCSAVEGAPMVIFEAKAYGVPTILFDMPYVAGVRPEEGAIVVPQGNCTAMSDVLTRLLSQDRSELKALGAKAVASLMAYTDEKVLEKWKHLFARLEQGDIPQASSDSLMRVTLQQFEISAAALYTRIEKAGLAIGHSQYLSSELIKAQGHAQYLSSELTKAQGHAQYLSSELTKAQGHAQYLSSELYEFESSRIFCMLRKLRRYLKKLKNYVQQITKISK